MFGLFKTPRFRDPLLGELTRSRGHWRGTLLLDGQNVVPLALCGDRTAPDPQALALARELPNSLDAWRSSIAVALFEHYGPYAEADVEEQAQESNEPPPRIIEPNQVWTHVSFQFVSVTRMAGELTTELGLAVAWDEEHTLGARFQTGKLIELNGSVLPP